MISYADVALYPENLNAKVIKPASCGNSPSHFEVAHNVQKKAGLCPAFLNAKRLLRLLRWHFRRCLGGCLPGGCCLFFQVGRRCAEDHGDEAILQRSL